MRVIKGFVGLVIMVLLGAALVLVLGPRQRFNLTEATKDQTPPRDISQITTDLAKSEARFTDIKPNQHKQILWAGEEGAKTALSIVYLHGFSASLQEIRPVPDNLGAALGANVYFPRLTGHGRAGDAMAQTHVQDWAVDLAQALQIGQLIGQRVIVISASTGGTLATTLLDDPSLTEQVAGMIFVSPNFAVHNSMAFLGKLPLFNLWGPMLGGETRSWEPSNTLHGQYWTTSYPTESIVPMMRLIDHVEGIDVARTEIPALFYFSDDDRVVDAAATRQVAQKWGGAVTLINPTLTEADDVNAHVIAGDIMSPNQTATATAEMLNWIKSLE
ncbi:lysophospholipase [Amylibacter marinus]|uniref:Lysophospholipase n=1 Tax=Amylibacter marinus TaxID=1475483 RepID=A0ABQ5VUL3_9RHOB|nr:alpha/beta fold hydrolase [Amylibacter marinus]GLQ34946.1 lysophospholipase [Amylibacter marinus]